MHSSARRVEFDLKQGALIVKSGTRFVRDYSTGKTKRVENVNVQGAQHLYISSCPISLPKRFKVKLETPNLPSVVRLRVFNTSRGHNYMNRIYPFSSERAIKAYTENLKENS